MTVHVTIMPNGRMSLPADIRRRLGLSGGGEVVLEEAEDGVILRTLEQTVARAQAIARRYTADDPDSSVDSFLAARRAEWGE